MLMFWFPSAAFTTWDKVMKCWSDCMYLPLSPFPIFVFHCFFSSVPVIRCVFDFIIHSPCSLHLPVAVSFSVCLYSEVPLQDWLQRQKPSLLYAETVSLYWGVCVYTEQKCCPLSPPFSLSLCRAHSSFSVSTREAKHKILSHQSVPWGPHFVY